MLKNILFFRDNIFVKRIYSIRKSIFAYSLASFLDIIIILFISSILSKVTSEKFVGNVFPFIFFCFILIAIRTIFVFLLRKYAFKKIFLKKSRDEKYLVNSFIQNRINQDFNANNDLKLFKEKIINSSNLAAINFDIPFFSVVAELLFAFGGIIILLNIFGIKILLFNLPVFIILIVFSKLVSRKLRRLGTNILNYTEKRLITIDNISEIAIELSALKYPEKLVDYFSKINSPFNQILSQEKVTSNMTQIYTESASFIIILTCVICLITNITQTSLANSATSLIVLSRLVPSFTRSVYFITQLQFGVPSVRELSRMYNY